MKHMKIDVGAHVAMHEARKRAELRAWYAEAQDAAIAERAGGLRELAVATGQTVRTLQSAALVGRRIAQSQFDTLITWRDASGRPLTKSILIALARISLPARAALLEELFDERRRVRRARQRARSKRP